MAQAKQIETILRDIQTVDFQGQLEILEKLVGIIKRPVTRKPKKKHSPLELEGLGKEIWNDIDADDYIDKERNSWN